MEQECRSYAVEPWDKGDTVKDACDLDVLMYGKQSMVSLGQNMVDHDSDLHKNDNSKTKEALESDGSNCFGKGHDEPAPKDVKVK